MFEYINFNLGDDFNFEFEYFVSGDIEVLIVLKCLIITLISTFCGSGITDFKIFLSTFFLDKKSGEKNQETANSSAGCFGPTHNSLSN